MTRLNILRQRRERLISLNLINRYTQTDNSRIVKYYKTLLAIKREINDIECVNVRPPNAKIAMTVADLVELKHKTTLNLTIN
jgi:hypothetical protein